MRSIILNLIAGGVWSAVILLSVSFAPTPIGDEPGGDATLLIVVWAVAALAFGTVFLCVDEVMRDQLGVIDASPISGDVITALAATSLTLVFGLWTIGVDASVGGFAQLVAHALVAAVIAGISRGLIRRHGAIPT